MSSRDFVRARKDFSWTNSHHIAGDLRTCVQKLKDATPNGVLLGSGKLATELDRLDLIDEYKLLVHPRSAGYGPTLYETGLLSTRCLEMSRYGSEADVRRKSFTPAAPCIVQGDCRRGRSASITRSLEVPLHGY